MPKTIIEKSKKVGYTLDNPIDEENGYYLGTCVCGTKGICSCQGLEAKLFCRNKFCDYYDQYKYVDKREITLILEEKGCKYISNNNDIILINCVCGMEQTIDYSLLFRNNWCINYSCKHYTNPKVLTDKIILKWFSFENYEATGNIDYVPANYFQNIVVKCPNQHMFTTSVHNWILGLRCNCEGNTNRIKYDITEYEYDLKKLKGIINRIYGFIKSHRKIFFIASASLIVYWKFKNVPINLRINYKSVF